MAVYSFLLSRAIVVISVVVLGMQWQLARNGVPSTSAIALVMIWGIWGTLVVAGVSLVLAIITLWKAIKKRPALYNVAFSIVPFLLVAASLALQERML
jgi:hypothetical protein